MRDLASMLRVELDASALGPKAPDFARISERQYYELATALAVEGVSASKKNNIIAIPLVPLRLVTNNSVGTKETEIDFPFNHHLVFDPSLYEINEALQVHSEIFRQYGELIAQAPDDVIQKINNGEIKVRVVASAQGVWTIADDKFPLDYEPDDAGGFYYRVKPGTGRICLGNDQDFNMLTYWGKFNVRKGGTLAVRFTDMPSLVEALNQIVRGELNIEEALFVNTNGVLRSRIDIYGMDPGFYEANYNRVPLPLSVAEARIAYDHARATPQGNIVPFPGTADTHEPRTEVYFAGLHEPGAQTPPDRAYQHNKALVERGEKFNSVMDVVLAKNDNDQYISSRDTILQNLDLAYARFSEEFEGMSSQQLMRFFNAYLDLAAPELMIRLYENSNNPYFQNAPTVQERMAFALNQLNRLTESVEWSLRALADPALIKAGLSPGEMYAALGKAYSIQQLAAEALSQNIGDATAISNYRRSFGLADNDELPSPAAVQSQSSELKIASGTAYKKGFLDHFAYYPGINAVYSAIDTGNVEEARKNAELVYLATLRDGGLESDAYWTTVTMVESLMILGEGYEDSLRMALEKVARVIKRTHTWRFDSTFGKWNAIVLPSLQRLVDDPIYGEIAQTTLRRATEIKEELTRVATDAEYRLVEVEITRTPGQLLLLASHGYRGMGLFDTEMVQNNFSYGGVVAHVLITRRDRHEFMKIMSMPVGKLMELLEGDVRALPPNLDASQSLLDINDTNLFIETTQIIIRQNFGSGPKKMEIIDNPYRGQQFDETTTSVDAIAGAPTDPDLRKRSSFNFKTSVAAEFAKGVGDCRHYAQSQQIMFDVWQEWKLSEHLRRAHDTLDAEVRRTAIDDFKDLERTRLRTIDIQAQGTLAVETLYRPKRPENDPEGFIFDPHRKAVEGHTMNMLFKLDSLGGIEQSSLCCAFYHEVYPWGFMPVDPAAIMTTLVQDKPHFEFPAAQLERVVGALGNKVPVWVSSEGFSGSRTKKVDDDPGHIYERGHVVEFDMINELRRRPTTRAQLVAIREFVKGSKNPVPANTNEAS